MNSFELQAPFAGFYSGDFMDGIFDDSIEPDADADDTLRFVFSIKNYADAVQELSLIEGSMMISRLYLDMGMKELARAQFDSRRIDLFLFTASHLPKTQLLKELVNKVRCLQIELIPQLFSL